MKYLMFISSIVFLTACTKSKNVAKTTTPTYAFQFIKTWKADTLVALPRSPFISYDSIITFKSGDTSCIKYNDTKLYLFYMPTIDYNQNDSLAGYLQVYISPVAFDTSAAWSTSEVLVYKYWDASYSAWVSQTTAITISKMFPHFDTTSSNLYHHY